MHNAKFKLNSWSFSSLLTYNFDLGALLVHHAWSVSSAPIRYCQKWSPSSQHSNHAHSALASITNHMFFSICMHLRNIELPQFHAMSLASVSTMKGLDQSGKASSGEDVRCCFNTAWH